MSRRRDACTSLRAAGEPFREAALLGAVCAVVGLLLLAVTGCATHQTLQAERVGEAAQPAPYDLSTPESAVRSYLDWVSFSYRMANSEIATATMTPEESVRVDSYIELNRQKGQGIEQSLQSLEFTGSSVGDSTAVLAARESWAYRYFSLETLEYSSQPLTASYDTTYTLVSTAAGWLVDTVEASSDKEVP